MQPGTDQPSCSLTSRSSGRSKACCARFSLPLISNVGPQLVRQVVRVALWSGLAPVRSSCIGRFASSLCVVAGSRISRRSQPGCPSVGGPLTVVVSPKNECVGLTLHEHCATWAPVPRSRISLPFKARRAVRPSAASGRPVKLGAAQSQLHSNSHAQKRREVCQRAVADPRKSHTLPQRSVWLPSAHARSLLPRLAVAQPVDRADVLKRAAHALARRSSPTLGPSW